MGLTQPSTLSMQDQWVGSGRSGLPDRSYFFIFGPSTHLYIRPYTDLSRMGPVGFLSEWGPVLDVYVNRETNKSNTPALGGLETAGSGWRRPNSKHRYPHLWESEQPWNRMDFDGERLEQIRQISALARQILDPT